jgi:hypothetical protein
MNHSKKKFVKLLKVILRRYVTIDFVENQNISELLEIEFCSIVRDGFEKIYPYRIFVENHTEDESI